jgi:hypothetical protein
MEGSGRPIAVAQLFYQMPSFGICGNTASKTIYAGLALLPGAAGWLSSPILF